MNTLDKKLRFVNLRANNMSLAKIADELGVSKRTCSNWDAELKKQIEAEQNKRSEELTRLYSLQRDERRKRLLNLLHKIDIESDKRDLASIPTENLIKLKLKIEAEIANESLLPTPLQIEQGTTEEVKTAIIKLCKDIASKNISSTSARVQLESLKALYDMINRDNSW